MSDEQERYEPSLRDLCERQGWDFIDLGRQLDPPVSNTTVSLWARGLRPLPPERATQIAECLNQSESLIWRSIAEGTRRHALRQQYLQRLAALSSTPQTVIKRGRPRKASVA